MQYNYHGNIMESVKDHIIYWILYLFFAQIFIYEDYTMSFSS